MEFGGSKTPSAVPVPAAVWLFGSGLLGLISSAKRKSKT
ncbi:PEP-CTERM sorting domain-containing protein [Methylocucumis oryzae]